MSKSNKKLDEIKNLMNRLDESSNTNLEVMCKYFGLKKENARPINESGINRLLSNLHKNGGIIISASRSLKDDGDIPDDLIVDYAKWVDETGNESKEEFIKIYNIKKTKSLISQLSKSNYSYSPVYGGYKGKNGTTDLYEPSFVVYCFSKDGQKLNFEELKKYAINLCGEYNQETVYLREPNGLSYYITQDGIIKAKETEKQTKINRPKEPFFTALKKNHVQRFTDDLEWFEEGHNNGSINWYGNPGPSDYSGRHLTYMRGEIIL